MEYPTPDMEVIDSRDVEEAITELQWERDHDPDGLSDDDTELLEGLKELASEGKGYGDWEYGTTLIRADFFADYAQELASDIGAYDPSAPWPLSCIDWDRAASELKYDYIEIDFLGTAYYMRA